LLDEIIALMGGAKAVGPTMLMAVPFLFERKTICI